MVPVEVEQWLSSVRSTLTEVSRRAKEAVRGYCETNGHAFIWRSKDAESLAEKLETGRIPVLCEIDDLFGCSVIISNLTLEEKVIADLEFMFAPVSVKRRESTFKSPEAFRFEATRFIGRLRITDIDDPRLGQLSFEIQIRTAFEHAWSVATHGEAYKANKVDWKLERLAAQMKALVEQLDMLAVDYENAAGSIVQHPFDRTDCESLALEKLASLVIPEECKPAKWGLLAKNVVTLADTADWGERLPLITRVERLLEVARAEAA